MPAFLLVPRSPLLTWAGELAGTRDCRLVRRREHAEECLQQEQLARRPSAKGRSEMEVVHERCCGLDVHKKTVVACVMTGPEHREVRTFGTVTRELLRLQDWLDEERVTHVAM